MSRNPATSPYSLDFELQGLPRSQTNNYGHRLKRWRDKKAWEERVAVATVGVRPKVALVQARIRITRCSSSEPDFDNLVASSKPLMDGLVKAGIIRDDKPSVVGQPAYIWQKVARKQGRVRIQVDEVVGYRSPWENVNERLSPGGRGWVR